MSANEVRTRILEIARRRQKPGSGSSQEFLRQRTAMKQWPDLSDMLGETPFDPGALEDVESMIVLGRMEMQP